MLYRLPMMKLTALVFIAAVLASCAGGSSSSTDGGQTGGADYVTFSINNGSSMTYTERTSSSAPLGYDPYIKAYYDTSNSTMTIYMRNGYSNFTYDEVLEIAIKTTVGGTYQILPGTNDISYRKTSATTTYIAQSGTITVSTYGQVGSHMQGSFNIQVCTPPCTSGTVPMSGTFYVTREANI